MARFRLSAHELAVETGTQDSHREKECVYSSTKSKLRQSCPSSQNTQHTHTSKKHSPPKVHTHTHTKHLTIYQTVEKQQKQQIADKLLLTHYNFAVKMQSKCHLQFQGEYRQETKFNLTAVLEICRETERQAALLVNISLHFFSPHSKILVWKRSSCNRRSFSVQLSLPIVLINL